MDALTRKLICETLPYPTRFRLAALTGKLGKALLPALPEAFAAMLSLLPDKLPPAIPLPPVLPAQGERRGKVALLLGCVQHVLAPEINHAAAQVLARNGVEVHIPRQQGCCGSILLHVGEEKRARDIARRNFGPVPDDVDAIITTAAGCGSGMKDYELLFKGQADAAQAAQFSQKVMDFSAYLAGLGLTRDDRFLKRAPRCLSGRLPLAACPRPRQRAARAVGRHSQLRLVEIADAGMCCGSAGTYNIDQPEIAAELARRKVKSILAAQPDLVVSGNIGCITQLRGELGATKSDAARSAYCRGIRRGRPVLEQPRPLIESCRTMDATIDVHIALAGAARSVFAANPAG